MAKAAVAENGPVTDEQDRPAFISLCFTFHVSRFNGSTTEVAGRYIFQYLNIRSRVFFTPSI